MAANENQSEFGVHIAKAAAAVVPLSLSAWRAAHALDLRQPCENCACAIEGPCCLACGQDPESFVRSIGSWVVEAFESLLHADRRADQTRRDRSAAIGRSARPSRSDPICVRKTGNQVMPHLTLKYERNDLRSPSGSARVMMGSHEVSRDCGTILELERALDRLHADLETIRKQARLGFAATRKAQVAEWSHANRP